MNSETTAAINAALNLANVFISNSLETANFKTDSALPAPFAIFGGRTSHTSNKIYVGKVRRNI